MLCFTHLYFTSRNLLHYAQRRAALYGAKTALIEESGRLGGTCVNVGVCFSSGGLRPLICTSPRLRAEEGEQLAQGFKVFTSFNCRQIMWHAADLADKLRDAAHGYHFNLSNDQPKFTWATFKPQRDAYIRFLNGIYDKNITGEGVAYYSGHAKLTSPKSIEISRQDGTTYTINTDKVVIGTGGHPIIPSDDQIPGASLGIDSDGFFDLEDQPKRVAVVGAGYIAVELAGVLHTLGTETHLIARHDKVLRTFDPSLQDVLLPWMQHTGINFHGNSNVVKVEGKRGGPLKVHLDSGKSIEVDTVLWAIGRKANTENLGLEDIGVKLDPKGNVVVDEWQETNVKGIFSIGDVQGKALLTPVAIAAGRRLSNRLYGGEKYKNDKLDYHNIPTVVFS